MGIVTLKTRLKSLQYGKDRPFGGSSNQPYIKRNIDVRDSEVGRTGGPDFLLRGGTLIPRRIGNDVSRMTQMFFDFKSPNGPLFTAKQNVLALTSTNFKAGFDTLKLRKRKEGLSGIDKVADAVGTFVENNIGFDKNNVYTPLSTLGQVVGGPLGLHLYKQGLNPITGPSKYLDYTIEGDDKKSRLLNLTGGKLLSNDTTLYQYIGGPGSINGVGRTRIRKYQDYNTNINKGYENIQLLSDKSGEKGKGNTDIFDFRQESGGSKVKTLNYNRPENRFEGRVNLGNPGVKGANRNNYQEGLGEALDKINALNLYKNQWVTGDRIKNDFVKFRIGVIDNANPKNKTYMHFRAIIDELSDSYTANWNSDNYMGRGEQFYRYNGFTRTVSLGWTVAAQSKQELIPMYQKLNYLASSLTPDYSKVGYMGGNLVTLTLGGWFYEQPGIITSMTLSPPQESPWEIAIPADGGANLDNPIESDASIKELPHIIKVTGVQFIPIHEFIPKIQKNSYKGFQMGVDGLVENSVDEFGPERYIALANGKRRGDNNYDRQEKLDTNIKPQKIEAPVLTDINQLG